MNSRVISPMPQDLRILLTGGTGLIGKCITRTLLSAGFEVIAITRRLSSYHIQGPGIRWIEHDFSKGSIKSRLEGVPFNCLVHAAAWKGIGTSPEDLRNLVQVNLTSTIDLLDLCDSQATRCVVFISSYSLLRKPLENPISEKHPVGPTTPYALSKLLGEELVKRYALAKGVRSVILRISSPVPTRLEELPNTVVKKWLELASHGNSITVYGSGTRSQDFVHVEDIACAVHKSIVTQEATGLYNIASGRPLSMLILAQEIARLKSVPIDFQGVDPNEADRWLISIDRARSDLGFMPKTNCLPEILGLAGQLN